MSDSSQLAVEDTEHRTLEFLRLRCTDIDWIQFVGLSQTVPDPNICEPWDEHTGGNSLTLLHVAAYYARPDYCGLLLARGAHVDSRTMHDETPLGLLCSRPRALTELPVPEPDSASSVSATAKLLIQRGADVNAKSLGGGSPLHGAARLGDIALARCLIENGADVKALAGLNGMHRGTRRTPLREAVKHGWLEMAKVLLEAGADPAKDHSYPNLQTVAFESGGHAVHCLRMLEAEAHRRQLAPRNQGSNRGT